MNYAVYCDAFFVSMVASRGCTQLAIDYTYTERLVSLVSASFHQSEILKLYCYCCYRGLWLMPRRCILNRTHVNAHPWQTSQPFFRATMVDLTPFVLPHRSSFFKRSLHCTQHIVIQQPQPTLQWH